MTKTYTVTIGCRTYSDATAVPEALTETNVYRQEFPALDVAKLITHLNTMPPPPKPRATRRDAGTHRNATAQLQLEGAQ